MLSSEHSNLRGFQSSPDNDMFIRGHFMGVILISAGILELVLADQLRSTGMTQEEVQRFGLEQMVILGRRIGILNANEAGQFNELRKLRNALIHANAGRLDQMAKKRYKIWGSRHFQLGCWLVPPAILGGWNRPRHPNVSATDERPDCEVLWNRGVSSPGKLSMFCCARKQRSLPSAVQQKSIMSNPVTGKKGAGI